MKDHWWCWELLKGFCFLKSLIKFCLSVVFLILFNIVATVDLSSSPDWLLLRNLNFPQDFNFIPSLVTNSFILSF